RVGEPREALGAVALACVEVVADGADDAHLLARAAGNRLPEHRVRLACPVYVGCQNRRDQLVGRDQSAKALVIDRFAEAHEAAAAPCADGNRPGIDRGGAWGHVKEFKSPSQNPPPAAAGEPWLPALPWRASETRPRSHRAISVSTTSRS